MSGVKLAKALGVKLADLAEIVEGGAAKEETDSPTYRPDPDELADLLEVIARSQRDGPGARVSLESVIDALKAQNAETRAKQSRQKQATA